MIATVLAICACFVIAARLLLFRRGTRRHCWYWAALAYLMINVSLALAVNFMLYLANGEPVPWYVAGLLHVLAFNVLRTRGNVAKLWRLRP